MNQDITKYQIRLLFLRANILFKDKIRSLCAPPPPPILRQLFVICGEEGVYFSCRLSQVVVSDPLLDCCLCPDNLYPSPGTTFSCHFFYFY